MSSIKGYAIFQSLCVRKVQISYSEELKFRPNVVRSLPRASVFKSKSVIRITESKPMRPNGSFAEEAGAC